MAHTCSLTHLPLADCIAGGKDFPDPLVDTIRATVVCAPVYFVPVEFLELFCSVVRVQPAPGEVSRVMKEDWKMPAVFCCFWYYPT